VSVRHAGERRVGSYDLAVFAGDRDRERATAALREHYAHGRLTLDEIDERTERVLTARSRADLRGALSNLPVLPDVRDLVARGGPVVQAAVRGAVLVVLTSAYVLFSFALLLVLGLTLLVEGGSNSVLLGFLLVWLLPTYLLSRAWRR
jgi:Domain of unknown function (DUF1707)